MAKPIKPPPILRGIDALNFKKKLEQNKETKISSEEISRIQANAIMFDSLFKK